MYQSLQWLRLVFTKVVPPPVVVTPEPEKKSSGSLAWLLLTAPLAFMRRRKQK